MIVPRRAAPGLAALVMLLAGLSMLACCGRCADCVTKDDRSGAASGGAEAPLDSSSPTILQQNLSEAEILVERVETIDGAYVLTGRVISTRAVGGSPSIAESGQTLSLKPFFPGGSPDRADAGHRRMLDLAGRKPGETVRCRIARDSRGEWRIVSAE